MAYFDSLFGNAPKVPLIGEVNFVIYTKDIFEDPEYLDSITFDEELDKSDVADNVIAASFQGLYTFGIKYQANIPYEPLENGEFSNDSILDTPFNIGLVATVAPAYNVSKDVMYNITSDEDRREYIADIEDMLVAAIKDKKLLVLLQSTPLFKTYDNLKLSSFEYEISPDNLNMTVYMQFQQIRITNTQYEYIKPDQVANESFSDVKNNGANQTTVPIETIASLLP